jgi:hypothetical protein
MMRPASCWSGIASWSWLAGCWTGSAAAGAGCSWSWGRRGSARPRSAASWPAAPAPAAPRCCAPPGTSRRRRRHSASSASCSPPTSPAPPASVRRRCAGGRPGWHGRRSAWRGPRPPSTSMAGGTACTGCAWSWRPTRRWCWWSTISSGRTRPRWAGSTTSPGGSTTCRCWWSPPPATPRRIHRSRSWPRCRAPPWRGCGRSGAPRSPRSPPPISAPAPPRGWRSGAWRSPAGTRSWRGSSCARSRRRPWRTSTPTWPS